MVCEQDIHILFNRNISTEPLKGHGQTKKKSLQILNLFPESFMFHVPMSI